MKFFIINLEKDIEKKEKISSLCESLGLDYEIIQAVYGKELSGDEIVKNTYPEEEQLKRFKRKLTLGEIGCSMSHRYCYQRIINDGLDEAVVLEDDAIFDGELLKFLKYKNEFPNDLELLLIGHYMQVYNDDGFRIESPYSLRFNQDIGSWKIKRLVGGGNGTHGYYINKKGAQKLFDVMHKISLPSDHYTSRCNYVNMYALFPSIINQELHNTSNVQENFKVVKKSKFRKYIKLIKNKIQFFIPSLKPLKPYK